MLIHSEDMKLRNIELNKECKIEPCGKTIEHISIVTV